MLFTGSPLSINWFKFTVMVLDNAGGMLGTGASCAAASAEGKLVFGAGVTGAVLVTACDESFGEPPAGGALLFADGDGGGITSCIGVGVTSALPIVGSCDVSTGSEVGRVTIA